VEASGIEGGAVEQLLQVVNSETVVVPGHGPIGNRDSLLTFRNMLRTIEGRIQPMIASGESFSEILAARPTSDSDPLWGGGYVTGDLFVRMVLAGFGVTEQPKRVVAW
jgi:cyclase